MMDETRGATQIDRFANIKRHLYAGWVRFQRLVAEGLASALGRLIEDTDLRRRPGEDGTALHRTRLDIEVCAERLVATWTESVCAGKL
jgi:hypothetical protein